MQSNVQHLLGFIRAALKERAQGAFEQLVRILEADQPALERFTWHGAESVREGGSIRGVVQRAPGVTWVGGDREFVREEMQRAVAEPAPQGAATGPMAHGDYVYITRAEYERTLERLRLLKGKADTAATETGPARHRDEDIWDARAAANVQRRAEAGFEPKPMCRWHPSGACSRCGRAMARFEHRLRECGAEPAPQGALADPGVTTTPEERLTWARETVASRESQGAPPRLIQYVCSDCSYCNGRELDDDWKCPHCDTLYTWNLVKAVSEVVK